MMKEGFKRLSYLLKVSQLEMNLNKVPGHWSRPLVVVYSRGKLEALTPLLRERGQLFSHFEER